MCPIKAVLTTEEQPNGTSATLLDDYFSDRRKQFENKPLVFQIDRDETM